MADIKDIDELKVRKIGNLVYEVRSIYKGVFRKRLYVGCTRKQAVSHFKKMLGA